MPNWGQVFKEIQEIQFKHNQESKQSQLKASQAINTVRHNYLEKLKRYTQRNIIAYYSGFLSKPGAPSGIADEDKNGFMMVVHGLRCHEGLDLILHTEGGGIGATQSIVNYLHKKFEGNIRAIVPQIAMSAGTMIACSCKEILMAKHSNLGPIDPHLDTIPAYGVIEEFERAYKEIKQSPDRLAVWQPILSQYPPAFLGQCEYATKWSDKFVAEQLQTVMFAGKTPAEKRTAKQIANRIVKTLSNYRRNKSHSRHLHYEDIKKIGLKVTLIEDDQNLQDLVLTVHHCYMHAMMNSPAYKITENHNGVMMVKSFVDPSQKSN